MSSGKEWKNETLRTITITSMPEDPADLAKTLLVLSQASDELNPDGSMVSLSITSQCEVFTVGDSFVFGGAVIATYEDGSTVNVTEEAEFSGYDLTVAGSQTVIVSVDQLSTSYIINVLEKPADWYLKGSMNDWQATPEYKFILKDDTKPDDPSLLHQYLLTVELKVNDEFKFHLLDTETWLGLSSIESGGAKANFEEYNNNIRVKTAGKYRFYLKQYSGYYSVYSQSEEIISYVNSAFAITKLSNNVLTIDGVAHELVGTTVGEDTNEFAFKEIEAFVDNEGLINIRVGNATFKGEDYQQASNFVLANLDYLETKDGLLFCVQEGGIYDITNSITNGYATGDSTIATDATVEITLHANTGYVIPETVTVTGASYTYSNGVVSLSNPTDDITITATCLEQLQAPYIELVEVE